MGYLVVLSGLLWVATLLPVGLGLDRVYYIAAVEREWNYAPTGRNKLTPQPQSVVDRYVLSGTNRIGSTYRKTIYGQYKDATYRTEIPTPSWLGLYGPIIRGEVGDNIIVHFRNNASREFSIHPHGLFYLKDSEGAIYVDGTSGRFKSDDVVMPGSEVTLTWTVHPDDAPSQDDPACIPYVYHSHVDTPSDTNTGLIGVISVCKPGTLNSKGVRTDVDHEFFLIAKVFDENISWMLSDNLKKCGDPGQCKTLLDDSNFIESNMMYALNGYVYGQLPGLEFCAGHKVAWHVIGMGSEVDVHSIEFHGHVLHTELTMDDNIQVFPAVFKTGMMTSVNPGLWVITCMLSDHQIGGMNAFFMVKDCGLTPPKEVGTIRHHFLSIEEEEWNYGPSGLDNYNGVPLTTPGRKSELYFTRDNNKIGGKYKKYRFYEYLDSTFTTRKSSSDKSLGILGPVIRAEAGDYLEITLKNNGKAPFSFLGHGLAYKPGKGEEYGLPAHAEPGHVHTYQLHVPNDVIGEKDPDCVVKLYYSEGILDVNSGVIGPLQLCRKGSIDPNTGRQRHITKEFFLLFSSFDESNSWLLQDNIKTFSNPDLVDQSDPSFKDSNLMHGINGRSFGNLEGLNMCLGDNITWHVFSYGTTENVQSPYFHGNAFSLSGTHRDVGTLISAESHSLLMIPDNPGTWALVSAADLMMESGVTALYTVEDCGMTSKAESDVQSGTTRTYNIGIVETDWDYLPQETDLITGMDLNDPRAEFPFVRDDEMFIGDTYRKALYREYTDDTFKHQKSRDSDDIHLGIMGPLIKAEVGDRIQINLKNMANRKYSIHPHGLFYTKCSEGTSYNDGYNGGTQPGQMRTYMWDVPERAGPGSEDPNCIPWMYSSAIEPAIDTQVGLIGAIIICRKGILDSYNKRTDVDREFAILLHSVNETKSWYVAQNIARFAPARVGTNYADDSEFMESNIYHSINGHLADNSIGLEMKLNDTVAWYLLASGSGVGLHTLHFHGQTFTHVSKNNHRNDVIELYPGTAEEIEMRTHAVGKWILHCHVTNHISAGMETTYTVLP